MPATCLAWFFFFNDTATTEIYTLSLHDALPISAFSRLWSPGCGMSITTLLPSTRSTPVARRGPTLVTHRRVSTPGGTPYVDALNRRPSAAASGHAPLTRRRPQLSAKAAH